MKWIITPGLEDRVDPRSVRIGAPWFQINLSAENIGNGNGRRREVESNGHMIPQDRQIIAQGQDQEQAQDTGLAEGTMADRDDDDDGEEYDNNGQDDVLDDPSASPEQTFADGQREGV